MTERAHSFPPKQDVVGTGISLLTFDDLMASFYAATLLHTMAYFVPSWFGIAA